MQEYLDFAARHPFLMGAVSAVVAMILFWEVRHVTRRYKEARVAQAVHLINRDSAWVLDVREDTDAHSARIPHSRRIALTQLPERMDELKDMSGPVIVYCGNGIQSQRACRLLAREDFEEVYVLKGGLGAWRHAGMPLETD